MCETNVAMVKLHIYFVLCVALIELSLCQDETEEERIVGGGDAVEGVAPYQASLRLTNNNEHFCGGSIINGRWIISAAHCFSGTTQYYVMVGSVLLNGPNTRYEVSKTIVHPWYDSKTFKNDIAMVRTAKSIVFQGNVAKIGLNMGSVPDGATLKVTGWGFTSNPGVTPNNMKILYTKQMSNSDCVKKWSPNSVYRSNLCSYLAVGQGMCFGDSGGPVVYNGRLAGVVSWVSPCAVGFPDVHTRISSHLMWISYIFTTNIISA